MFFMYIYNSSNGYITLSSEWERVRNDWEFVKTRQRSNFNGAWIPGVGVHYWLLLNVVVLLMVFAADCGSCVLLAKKRKKKTKEK